MLAQQVWQIPPLKANQKLAQQELQIQMWESILV
jgi:hypothetical protein